MTQILDIIGISATVLVIICLYLAVRAFSARRWMGALVSSLLTVIALLCATTAGLVLIGTQGYEALTHEQVVATVTTTPTGPQKFRASMRLADGRTPQFELEGDEILIEAHILKWKYIGNLLGFTTLYELDRVGGRYSRAEDENSHRHTVFPLGQPKPVDLFELARKYTPIAFLVDAEYGSGTYTEVGRPSQYEVSVSTTGLLIRKIGGVD